MSKKSAPGLRGGANQQRGKLCTSYLYDVLGLKKIHYISALGCWNSWLKSTAYFSNKRA